MQVTISLVFRAAKKFMKINWGANPGFLKKVGRGVIK